jgi:hypothetical protein
MLGAPKPREFNRCDHHHQQRSSTHRQASVESRLSAALSGSSPITVPFLLLKHTRSKGPSLHRHYPASQVPLALSDARMVRHPVDAVLGFATPQPSRAFPTDSDYLPHMPCPLPRWFGSVHSGYVVGALPRRALPDPLGLPHSSAGSAPTWSLSRPARASYALRPARLRLWGTQTRVGDYRSRSAINWSAMAIWAAVPRSVIARGAV